MRLLLIGCTGLVGRGLIPLLHAAGHQLTVVSRRPASAVDLPDGIASQLHWIQADPAAPSSCASSAALTQALAACHGVVNPAGQLIAEQLRTP